MSKDFFIFMLLGSIVGGVLMFIAKRYGLIPFV